MTSRVSADRLEALLPVLSSLARMASQGMTPRGETLDTLLEAAGIGIDPELAGELGRWSELLARVHADPSPERQSVTVEALMLRGVSEAPALLATRAAAHRQVLTSSRSTQLGAAGEPPASSPAPSPIAPPAPPRFSVPSIDLGDLAARAVAVVEVSVTGGPATVASDSAFVQVEPASVGREPGAVRVTARLPAAGSLWASVTATGPGGAAALPVIARVAEPAAATAVSAGGEVPAAPRTSSGVTSGAQAVAQRAIPLDHPNSNARPLADDPADARPAGVASAAPSAVKYLSIVVEPTDPADATHPAHDLDRQQSRTGGTAGQDNLVDFLLSFLFGVLIALGLVFIVVVLGTAR